MKDKNLIIFERRGGFVKIVVIAAIIFIFIVGIAAIGTQTPRLLFLTFPVIMLVILPELARKRLVSVRLDMTTGDITVVLSRWERVHKRLIIPVESLNVSFKDELTMRGGKRKVLRLFHRKKHLASAEEAEGWETQTLETLAVTISELKDKITHRISP